MPTKKTRVKKTTNKQRSGWFWEQRDPIFGKSNKWLAVQAGKIDDNVIKPTDKFLKETKLLSTIAAPVVGFATGLASLNPIVGTVAGATAAAGLRYAGYGKHRGRPHGKHMQYGSGSPFMNPNAASFGTIQF